MSRESVVPCFAVDCFEIAVNAIIAAIEISQYTELFFMKSFIEIFASALMFIFISLFLTCGTKQQLLLL
jgi:hypothetical protein